MVVTEWRLPRVLMALLIGAALGVSGAIFQSLTRNPLGSPDVMGFNTGAWSGVLVAMVMFGQNLAAIAMAAMAGGILTALAVWLLLYLLLIRYFLPRVRKRSTQRAAARALGLTHRQTLRHVVVPQAVRRVMPALMNDLVSLQKDSGLIAVLGVVDAIRAAQISSASDFNYTPYVVAGVLFICLTVPMARFTDWLARRQGMHVSGGAV